METGEQLANQYKLRFQQAAEYRNSVWTILCGSYFAKYIPANAHVLDLGCGWGDFINNVRADVKLAMDLNPDSKSHLQDGIDFVQQDCTQEWPISSECLDIVFTSNFLEHLPSKKHVESAIRESRRCLKEGGRLICLGPNIRFAAKEYWDFWDHEIPISDRSLIELLDLNGFATELRKDRFLPYSMSTGFAPPLIALRLYLKLPIFWRFFGKQFLVVSRKMAEPSAPQSE